MASFESLTISEKSEEAWPAAKIRDTFVQFFVQKHGHTHWPSSSVVPHEDPTLLFANAGMNQYKSIFLGTIDPNTAMSKLKRAVNSQKCIRAGGKHNDLDDVGKDLYHHTFFEMLGNWSFGDYFKEQAVAMAWECLTVAYGLDPTRLYATYFGGDAIKAPGVPADEETRLMWLKYLPAERVLPFDAGDNFWEMGDTGPCGPCTEIHYDRIGGRDAGPLVNMDDPNVLEIWNNVFIQYNRDSTGLKSLPSQHVDTGMGFERLASILQGKMSNYDTDIFMPLFKAIQELSGCPTTYGGKVGAEDVGTIDMAYRVVADHVRTLSFAIADGAVPDALGRGYVLRRVLRRAVWYAQRFLGAPKEFLYKVVPTLCSVLGDAFPEIVRGQETVMAVLQGEERDFNRTIDKGARFFAKKADALPAGSMFPGKDAFHLSGSLGFPLDLTQIMAEERGVTVDVAGYHEALKEEKAKNEAALAKRKASREGGCDMSFSAEQTSALSARGCVATDTEAKYVWHQTTEAKVVALFAGRGAGPKGDGFVESLTGSEPIAGVVLDSTSFYPEMGGQTYDMGELLADEQSALTVEDVQIYAGFVVHLGAPSAPIKVGDSVTCQVDYDRRVKVAPNHTMTHVLNFALREVLLGGAAQAAADAATGVEKCAQRGSFVDAQRLRFDFSWDAPLTANQLAAVETIVNAQIQAALPVDSRETVLAEAISIQSLRHMKGEAYPDPVRVVSVGASVEQLVADPTGAHWGGFSIELCGGTHVRNTRDAVGFALLEESGIAKGVRRIVGVTRELAAAAAATATTTREKLAALQASAVTAQSTPAQVEAFTTALKELKGFVDTASMSQSEKMLAREAVNALIAGPLKAALKAMDAAAAAAALGAFEALALAAAAARGTKGELVTQRIDFGADAKLWLKLHKAALAKLAPEASFCVLSRDASGTKFGVFAAVSDKHQAAGLDARAWCKVAADAAGGGKGGGKPNAASMQVPNLNQIDAAKDAATAFAHKTLGF